MEDVLGGRPPHPVVYEWIQLRGTGAMHSSTGNVVTAADMLGMTPPEVLRYLIMRIPPNKHIDFDPGPGLPTLVDEYDRLERLYYGHEEGVDPQDQRRAYELSQVDRGAVPMLRARANLGEGLDLARPGPAPVQVPYKHMVTLAQISADWDGVKGILHRTAQVSPGELDGAQGHEVARSLRARLDSVRFWLARFAPEEVKFALKDGIIEDVKKRLTPQQKGLLGALKGALDGADWAPDAIHTAVHDTAAASGMKAGAAFELLYLVFLGQRKGPRLGYFLHSLKKDFVLSRLGDAAAA